MGTTQVPGPFPRRNFYDTRATRGGYRAQEFHQVLADDRIHASLLPEENRGARMSERSLPVQP